MNLRSHFIHLAAIILLTLSIVVVQYDTFAANDPWPMWGYDQFHSNRSPYNGPNSPDLAWTYLADGALGSPVIAADGTLYTIEFYSYTSAALLALNPNGTQKWIRPGNYSNYGTAIAADGTIYAVNNGWSSSGQLEALAPSDGRLLWSYPVGYVSYSQSTIAADGTIYIAADSCPGTGHACVLAINANGTEKWTWDSQQGPCGHLTTPALSSGGDVYVNFADGCYAGLVHLDATGQFVWSISDDAIGQGYDSPSVGPDGTIYMQSGYTSTPQLYAINPDGTYKWIAPVYDDTNTFVGAHWGSTAISSDGSTVFKAAHKSIYAINNGNRIWGFDPGNTLGGNNITLTANGLLYFTQNAGITGLPPGTHGYLYALRASDRALIWSYDIGSSGDSPVIGSDGTLYVQGDPPNALGSGDGNMLYAFRCADGICAIPPHEPLHTVTNLNDSGAGSLRQAVADSIYGDTIQFQSGLSGTLTLSSTIVIDKNLTINGPGTSTLTISGNNSTRIFSIDPDITVAMSDLTMSNGHFDSSFDYGGAIENEGTLNLNNLVFSANFASNGGGALYNGGSLTISNSTLSGNSGGSNSSGGAIYNEAGATLDIQHSTFSTNNANSGGGAIYNAGTITISNSTLSGNYSVSSVSGGGAIDNSGNITAVNSTFADNHVGIYGYGGAIRNNGTTTLKNTIIANNPAFGYQCSGTSVNNGGGNLQFPDNDCGATIPVGDPKLAPLANNGGPTQTRLLLNGSAAIDTGVNATCAAAPVNNLDQRGQPRPSPGGGICDSGSVEMAAITAPEIAVQAPGNVNIPDGGTYNMGTTAIGTPFSRTIIVRNLGATNLTISTNPPTVTGNFSASNFGSTTLAQNASTTFNLTCSATTVGAPVTGTVSFGNNDSDENPYNFAVHCTVTESASNAAPKLNYFTTDTPTLTWNSLTGVTTYDVQIADNPGFTGATTHSAINGLSFTTPALPNGVHYWRVRAAGAANWSAGQQIVIYAP